MDAKVLIRSPQQCDRFWAQRVAQLTIPHCNVHAVQPLSVDVATTTRVRLIVRHDAPTLPQRWFLKLPSSRLRARLITALPGLVATETRFYRELAHEFSIPVPDVLASVTSRYGATLVLQDLCEVDAEPLAPETALNAGQVHAAVGLLANLHRQFAADRRFEAGLSWLGERIRRTEDRLGDLLAVPLMRRGMRLAAAHVGETTREQAFRYASRRRACMQVLDGGPKTLTHHDCHPGNWFWCDHGPGLLDWQLVRAGDGVGDVAYLLATALTPEVRRSLETALLEDYRQDTGLTCSMAELMTRYVQQLCYAFEAMVMTLAIGGLMPQDANLTLIERCATAVSDHDSFARLLSAA